MPHGSLIASFLEAYLLSLPCGKQPWRRWLTDISAFHKATTYGTLPAFRDQRAMLNISPDTLGKIAHVLLEAPDDYPASMLYIADLHLGAIVSGNIKPLRQIASEDDWFPGRPQ
jgi:hypothetical protein